jgi:signal transduction histidine kinase
MSPLPFNSDSRNYKAYFVSFCILSLLWGLFVLSAVENYNNYDWYTLLFISRLGLSIGAFCLGVYCCFKKSFSRNVLYYFLLICECVQSVFGCLEGPYAVAFSEYVGILFLMSSFAYRASFNEWLRKWAVIQFLPFLVLFFFKDVSMLWPLGNFVHNFSFIVVGIGLGVLILHLNAERYSALERNILLSAQLLEKEMQDKNASEARLNLARQVAHDLKAPLGVLRIVLRQNNLEQEGSSYIQNKDLLKQVLTRIEKINASLLMGYKISNFQEFAQGISLSRIGKSLDLLMKEKEVLNEESNIQNHFLNSIKKQNSEVSISETDLLRVVSNLYDNARESFSSMRDGMNISLKVEDVEDSFLLSVEDNGCGIPQQIVQRVCEEGFSHNKDQGHGIGLFSVKQIIERHGGKLSILSEQNLGTKVSVKLPLRSELQ